MIKALAESYQSDEQETFMLSDEQYQIIDNPVHLQVTRHSRQSLKSQPSKSAAITNALQPFLQFRQKNTKKKTHLTAASLFLFYLTS